MIHHLYLSMMVVISLIQIYAIDLTNIHIYGAVVGAVVGFYCGPYVGTGFGSGGGWYGELVMIRLL